MRSVIRVPIVNDTVIPTKLPSDERVFPIAWYAVGWSKELNKKPIKRQVLGQWVVLFRGSQGEARCVTAYCAHRGADLALGRCTNNGTLQCSYHGWEFTGDGTCVSIPAHPNRPIPSFAHITGYPVSEKAGLIWVYPQSLAQLGSRDNLPPLDVFPQLLQPEFALAPYDEIWNAHITRVVESVLDVSHLPFVHKKTIGRRLPKEVHEMRFDVPDKNTILIENGGGLLEYRYPQQWMLSPSRKAKAQFINFVTFTPIDRNQTRIFGYAGRTFARFVPGLNRLFSSYSRRILREDQAIVESQHPRPIPEALRMEAHVPADAPQVRFRQRWFEFLSGDEPKVVLPDESIKVRLPTDCRNPLQPL